MSFARDFIIFLVGLYSRSRVSRAVVTGTGRIGTHYIAKAANLACAGWVSVHEPENDLHDIFREGRIAGVGSRLKRLVVRQRARHWQLATLKSGFLECNPFLAQCPQLISTAMKGAEVAVIIREWSASVASFANLTANGNHYFLSDNDYRSRINGVDVKCFSQPEWAGLNRFEKIAFWWAEVNSELLEHAEHEGWYVVKFEELFGDHNSMQMAFLFEKLGMGNLEELNQVDYSSIRASNTSKGRMRKGSSDVKFTSEFVTSQVCNEVVLERVKTVGLRLEKVRNS